MTTIRQSAIMDLIDLHTKELHLYVNGLLCVLIMEIVLEGGREIARSLTQLIMTEQ